MSIVYSANPELHIWATATRNARDPLKKAKNKQMVMKRLYSSLVSLPEEVREQHSEEVKRLVSEIDSASPVKQTLLGAYSQE
jgi:ribosomal protein L19E